MRATTMTVVTVVLCLGACGDDDGGEARDSGVTSDAPQGSQDSGASAEVGQNMDSRGTTDTGQSRDSAPEADSAPQNDSAPQPDSAIVAATFTNVYDTVISKKCAPCHTRVTGSSGGLSMADRNTAFNELVFSLAEGGACVSTGLDRVKASESANSLLVKKVEAAPPCGARMPLGRTPLSADEIALIKRWIDDGAKDD